MGNQILAGSDTLSCCFCTQPQYYKYQQVLYFYIYGTRESNSCNLNVFERWTFLLFMITCTASIHDPTRRGHTFTSSTNLVFSERLQVVLLAHRLALARSQSESAPPPLFPLCLIERGKETGRESVKENTSGYVLSHNAFSEL